MPLLVLKGSTTSFEYLKMVLLWAIENIRDLREAYQAASLELIVEDSKKDASE